MNNSLRQRLLAIGSTALLFSCCLAAGGDAGEPSVETLTTLINLHLPGFSVAEHAFESEDTRANVVSGDFNGDGKSDIAAVLTEIAPPQAYDDGSPWHRAYVEVFLKSDLAYSDYQAVFLLGHGNRPRGYTLSVEGHGDNQEPDTLVDCNN